MSLTTLNEDLDNSETGVDITPAVTAQTRPAMILVDDEIMDVSAGTTSLTVTRGTQGSTAATHTTTTKVFAVERVEKRASSVLVYYYADDGGLAAKKISESVAATQFDLAFTGPNHLTDNTTGTPGATLPAVRVDSLANLGADVRTIAASLNAQINALETAVAAMSITLA